MNILGLMSGSSLDGLDMAICSFEGIPGTVNFQFRIAHAQTAVFPDHILKKLALSPKMNIIELLAFHSEFGFFLGEQCHRIKEETGIDFDYIASHGHTVYHRPEKKFTFQLGHGAAIAQKAELEVICDFRSADIAEGGLGAPFVPIADLYLFPEADICLNLGGISNISFKENDGIRAFDISPCNQLLNHVACKEGHAYDDDGRLARSGKLSTKLLHSLKVLNNFNDLEPRAIDNSWIVDKFIPILDKCKVNRDALNTVVVFIADEILKAIKLQASSSEKRQLLVTGGGAFNGYLMEVLDRKLGTWNISILETDKDMIEYKEALLMAFMGYLRVIGKPNALASVTGANIDTIGGSIYTFS